MLSPLLRLLLCLSLCSDAAISHTHGEKTKTTLTLSNYESTATNRNVHGAQRGSQRWHAAYERLVNEKDNGAARATSAKASWNAVRTWLNNVNSSSNSMKTSEEEKTKQRTVRKTEAPNGTVRVRLAEDRDEPWRTNENIDEDPAAMETHSEGCRHLKPSTRDKRGGHHENEPERICKHKRRTVHSRQRRNAKQGKKYQREISQSTLLLNESVDAPLATWEPVPKPMAQEQDTGFPFNDTSDYEQFTLPDLHDSTPFVPINTQIRRKHFKNPFYPVTAESYGAYAIMIVAAIIFTVGIIGNIAIMCIVCHNYYMRSISNSLLANLALWDFVVIFFCLPLVIFHELTKDWLLGEFSCKVIPYIEVIFSINFIWL